MTDLPVQPMSVERAHELIAEVNRLNAEVDRLKYLSEHGDDNKVEVRQVVGDIVTEGTDEWVVSGMAVSIGEVYYTRVRRNSMAHRIHASVDPRMRESLSE